MPWCTVGLLLCLCVFNSLCAPLTSNLITQNFKVARSVVLFSVKCPPNWKSPVVMFSDYFHPCTSIWHIVLKWHGSSSELNWKLFGWFSHLTGVILGLSHYQGDKITMRCLVYKSTVHSTMGITGTLSELLSSMAWVVCLSALILMALPHSQWLTALSFAVWMNRPSQIPHIQVKWKLKINNKYCSKQTHTCTHTVRHWFNNSHTYIIWYTRHRIVQNWLVHEQGFLQMFKDTKRK